MESSERNKQILGPCETTQVVGAKVRVPASALPGGQLHSTRFLNGRIEVSKGAGMGQ